MQENICAKKYDMGKLRMDLIPVKPLKGLADVFTRGAKKYGDDNWRTGLKWSRVYGALLRHLTAWWDGEEHDKEDGQHHLDSVAWCCFVLREYIYTHPEMDDRPNSNQETIMCGDCEEEYPNSHVCKSIRDVYFSKPGDLKYPKQYSCDCDPEIRTWCGDHVDGMYKNIKPIGCQGTDPE